jgi:hypothetical protein
MQTKFCFILAVTILLFGCKKNSTSDDASLKEERIGLLVNKKWQTTSDFYYQTGDNGTPIKNDNYGGIEYTIDDYVVYHPDFTMEWNDNQVLDPNDSNTVYTGTWQISDDGKSLTSQLLSPSLLPPYSREILSVTEKEYKTTDVRSSSEIALTYFTTYTVVP